MNKLFYKVAALSVGLAMAVGVGVGLGGQKSPVRARATVGEDSKTVTMTSNSVTNDGVTWALNNTSDYATSNTYIRFGSGTYIQNTTAISVDKTDQVQFEITTRKYGGPSDAQIVLTLDVVNSSGTSLTTGSTTVSPSSTSLVKKTSSALTFASASGTDDVFFRITSASTATSGKCAGVSVITVYYTAASGGQTTYTVTYDDNGATSGTVPVDPTEYSDLSNTVTVLGNEGNLAKTYYDFDGWNTKADGSGTSYDPDDTFTISDNVTLYAQWTIQSGYTLGNINFGSATGSLNINSASVSGSDSNSQTWSVVTAGTSSFTPNSAYAQIGSGSSPASSITFSTTFSSKMSFDSVEVKLGGFNGTTGSVAIAVDNKSLGSGSLNGGTDVTINSNSVDSGNVLTITITGIDKGVKAYYISYIAHQDQSQNSHDITTSTSGLTLSGITTIDDGDPAEITLLTAQKKRFTNLVVTGAGTQGTDWDVDDNVITILSVTDDITIDATIVDASIVSITVTGQKTQFAKTDSFSFGGTVTGTYNDNAATHATEEIDSSDYSVDSSDFVQGTVGTYTIVVSYSGAPDFEYTVTVADVDVYSLFTDALEEGYYVIVYNGYSLDASIASNRFGNGSPVIANDSITDPAASTIWYAEQDGEYWTLYNESTSKYAGGTTTKNQGALLDSVTNYAKWTVTGTETYEFENLGRATGGSDTNNKYLRQNGSNGWACYASATGGEVSLYKLVEEERTIVSTSMTVGTVSASTGDTEWTLSGFGFSVTYQGDANPTDVTSKTTFTVTESIPDPFPSSSTTTTVHVVPTFKGVDYSSESVTATLTAILQSALIPGTNGYSDSSETTPASWVDTAKTGTVYLNTIEYRPEGGANTGKYYSGDANWRFYQNESAKLHISAQAGYVITEITFTFSYSSYGKLVNPNDGTSMISSNSAWTPTAPARSFTFEIGSTSGTSGQIRFTQIAVKYAETTDPVVAINELQAEIYKDDTGTFTAQSLNATSPSYSWVSSDTNVLTVNGSTGAYEAVGTGAVTITVTMTCVEGSATDSITLTIGVGLISIEEANTIAAALETGAQTSYTVVISGYLISLDADNKGAGSERALRIANYKVDETVDDDIMIYGIYSSDAMRNYIILNGTITFKGYLKNYNGSYQLISPELVSYTDGAMEFAASAYASLTATCEAYGPEGITDSQWNTLASQFAALDEYAQAKLVDENSPTYNQDIAKWITRYTIIVEQGGKADFMNLGLTPGSSGRIAIFGKASEAAFDTTLLIVIASVLAVAAVGGYFFLRRKKEQ